MPPEERFEPFDVTRPDDYQGEANRFRVGATAVYGLITMMFGIAVAVIGPLTGASPVAYFVGGLFFLFGALSAAWWFRAFHRSRRKNSD